MNFQSELEKILEAYESYAILKDTNMFNEASMEHEFPNEMSPSKATQAITTLVLETLGEDEFEPIYRPNPDRHDIASDDRLRIRDSLRDELRTKFTNPKKEGV